MVNSFFRALGLGRGKQAPISRVDEMKEEDVKEVGELLAAERLLSDVRPGLWRNKSVSPRKFLGNVQRAQRLVLAATKHEAKVTKLSESLINMTKHPELEPRMKADNGSLHNHCIQVTLIAASLVGQLTTLADELGKIAKGVTDATKRSLPGEELHPAWYYKLNGPMGKLRTIIGGVTRLFGLESYLRNQFKKSVNGRTS